jgi:hypothetical protein
LIDRQILKNVPLALAIQKLDKEKEPYGSQLARARDKK